MLRTLGKGRKGKKGKKERNLWMDGMDACGVEIDGMPRVNVGKYMIRSGPV